jgi:hypothetical protein
MACLLIWVLRYDAGTHQSGIDADRGAGGSATLTCHFFQFQLLALAVSSLTIAVIQLCRKALLVDAVGLAPLIQSCLMTAVLVTVALTAITGTAEVKDDAAFWTSTHSLAYLDWQGGRAFPKAGLDNGHQSWQAMDRWIGWFPDWIRPSWTPIAGYGWGLSFSASGRQ